MKDEKLFKEKANSGYVVCFVEACKFREQCLRWIVGQHVSDTRESCLAVNARLANVATAHCPQFREARKVWMAQGMKHIFTDEMPKRIEMNVRTALIALYGRTYYFAYRRGDKLIPLSMQQEIRRVFCRYGWTGAVEFDGFVEDYDWS